MLLKEIIVKKKNKTRNGQTMLRSQLPVLGVRGDGLDHVVAFQTENPHTSGIFLKQKSPLV